MSEYCIASFSNLHNTPYAYTYINSLLQAGHTCTVLYWDRTGHDVIYKEKGVFYIPFSYKIDHKSRRLSKYIGYVLATKFIRKEIQSKDFKGIILLQTHVAVACEDILIKKYSYRYIIDIRDYTLENISIYYKKECMVIKKSYATVISSPAYCNFLPRHDYVVAHNYNKIADNVINEINNTKTVGAKNNTPITISYLGTIRFYEMDKKLIKIFANDERFQLEYIGTGSESLFEFCDINKIHNVKLFGTFAQKDTFQFYKHTDFINNLYGNNSNYLDFALSNRLYHSAQIGIPILVCPNTFMAKIVQRYNIGFIFDFNDKQIKEKLKNYFYSVNREDIIARAKPFLQHVERDNAKYMKLIERFCFI